MASSSHKVNSAAQKGKVGRKGEQIIPNETRIRQYWETLKDQAKEGDAFACAALIILTHEHKLTHTKLTDMALLCKMFQEQGVTGGSHDA